jgi:hypothetical protein
MSLRSCRAAIGIFVCLAIIHTWPLATDPAHLSRADNGDYLLNTWAVSWVAHQLPRDPIHLFDANIFYPERRTLAYSEAMVVQGTMAIPLRAAGVTPIATYNILLMAGMALTGWAFCLLVQRWTASWAAGYLAGSLAAFNSSVLVRLPHLQTQHAEFIPLMLYFLDRLFTTPGIRQAFLLGLGFALQGLTSIYLLVFTTWMMVFAAIGRAFGSPSASNLRVLAMLSVAGVTSLVLMAPYLLAYVHLHQLTGFERTIYDGELYAGAWLDYFSSGSRLHYTTWSHRFFDASRSPSFPGVAGSVLAILSFTLADTRRDPRVRMCAAAAVGCALVSFLPRSSIYPIVYRLVPLFRAVRVNAHLGQIVLMMLAVLAGFGMAGLERRWCERPSWPAIAVGLVLVVNVEALRAPLGYREFGRIPPIYADLAGVPHAIVADLPLWPPAFNAQMAWAMLDSTANWHPILNGYSGFVPQSYRDAYEALRDFPDEKSLNALHARGVTHVVVHRTALEPRNFAAISNIASLQWQNDDGDTYLYKLR